MTDSSPRCALAGVRVWDGETSGVTGAPQTLRIEDGRIAAIGTDPALARDAEVIEPGPDAVAVPGLMDAHVHLTLDPAVRSAEEQLAKPREQVVKGMEARAGAMLRAGITTARDLGGGSWLELELRDRIARGEVPGPRLLCAGQPLTSEGGHCHFWGGVVRDDDETRAAVRRQVERGADWIKVMATGGVMTRGTRITEPQFDAARLGVIRDEAAAHGRRVAAHCHGTQGIRNAVEARLRTVEHCSFAGGDGFGSDFDPALPARMAERHVWVSPTVNAGWGRRLAERNEQDGRFLRDMRACFRALRAAGVGLVASTDAGIPGVEHHHLPRALAVFAAFAELAPVEALRAATSDAARALGLEGETGRLAPGLAADVLVVRGSPLDDLSALERPLLVVARGELLDPRAAAA